MYKNFEEMALHSHEIYGTVLIYDEFGESGGNLVGFVCPNCGEAIYFDEWQEENEWMICPNCGTSM